ncbi:MAG: signal peptide peptidase SppA [Sedimentisphaerales bacterium]|nr:signal peptide peptidase SppA [Sedimentisphaerales bacterium]
MDFEQNNDDYSSPLPPEPPQGSGPPPVYYPPPFAPAKRRSGWRIFFRVIFVLSIVANIFLFFMLTGLAAIFMTGYGGVLTEEVLREGPSDSKVAVISVEGIIHGPLADDVYSQLTAAGKDKHVKGLIVRVNSPGGTISGSDRIYHEIQAYKARSGKPVVAFMEGVAASGGYYASVACDKIIAEPTTITGSIGVISWWLVVQELLEDKLGIMPVTVKSGKKKDWPSSFRKPDAEELKYIEEKLIAPAFERFVSVIGEGRQGVLTIDQIRRLADGGIYGADEARKERLIDDVGYLDDAINLIKSVAGIAEARVVEYRKPFSLGDFFSLQKPNTLRIDRNMLYELGTPQILYLWSAY